MKKNKLKVLLLVPMLDYGGMERICVMTADMLEKEYDVYLAVFSGENIFYKPQNVEIIDICAGVKSGWIGKIINVFVRIRNIKKIKRTYNIDITMSFGSTASLVNVLSKCKDKTIAAIHGYGLLDEKMRMQIIGRLSDVVVCCAKVITEEFGKRFKSRKLITLYNPYDVETIAKKSYGKIEEKHQEFFDTEDKIIVTMGRAHDVKGFWHLVKIFALLREKMKDVRMVIIGAGDFTEYQELARKLEVDSRILFTGLQQNPFAYLRLCDAYVLTSISEGLPNGLIEAMAVGLPVLSTNCMSGPAEILHTDFKEAMRQEEVYDADFGVLLPKLNPEKNLNPNEFDKGESAYAEKLYTLLANEDELATRREQALKRSEFFRTEQYEKNLVQILNNL